MVRRQKRIPRSRFPKNDFEICCQNAAKREESSSAKLLNDLVDLVGIEPTTSSMPWKRAPKLRHRPTNCGRQLHYCLCLGRIRQ